MTFFKAVGQAILPAAALVGQAIRLPSLAFRASGMRRAFLKMVTEQ
jgi:hypothetical protein